MAFEKAVVTPSRQSCARGLSDAGPSATSLVPKASSFDNLGVHVVQCQIVRTEPRTVIVSIARDATLDNQFAGLRLCLWFEAFSGQLVLLLDGCIVPLGWSVFPRRLRVRYLPKHTHPLDLLFEHALLTSMDEAQPH